MYFNPTYRLIGKVDLPLGKIAIADHECFTFLFRSGEVYYKIIVFDETENFYDFMTEENYLDMDRVWVISFEKYLTIKIKDVTMFF